GELGAWQVICWALIIATPLNLLVLLLGVYNSDTIEQALTTLYSVPWQAWASFTYVSLVSQLLAFFLWYKALDMGGIVKVSQIQSLQPFMTIFISMLILHESISLLSIVFCFAVVLTVIIGRKMPVYSQ
ncbi:MAG: EamA family transporter, partial [Thiohalomonadales bacterium]